MVQTEISQLSAECTEWLQILRNYRQDFQENEKALQNICRKSLQKHQLQDVEHFQNQFDIQLKNIHDLKLQIKLHDRKILETSGDNLKEDTYTQHESLLNEFLRLESTLQEIRDRFKNFISDVSC